VRQIVLVVAVTSPGSHHLATCILPLPRPPPRPPPRSYLDAGCLVGPFLAKEKFEASRAAIELLTRRDYPQRGCSCFAPVRQVGVHDSRAVGVILISCCCWRPCCCSRARARNHNTTSPSPLTWQWVLPSDPLASSVLLSGFSDPRERTISGVSSLALHPPLALLDCSPLLYWLALGALHL
jgi:hypothetical protein